MGMDDGLNISWDLLLGWRMRSALNLKVWASPQKYVAAKFPSLKGSSNTGFGFYPGTGIRSTSRKQVGESVRGSVRFVLN